MQEVERLTKSNRSSTSYSFSTFSTATLNRILAEYSRLDLIKYGIVLVAVGIYAWVVHSGLALMGVLLLASSTAAGLGVCSLLGLPMNLLSIHVLPFVSIGIAMRDMFIFLSLQSKNLLPSEMLQRVGPVVIMSALTNAGALLVAAILPVTALRIFCLQCAVVVLFHTASLLLVLPALLALEVRCRKSDVPCFRSERKNIAAANNNNDDPVSLHFSAVLKSGDSNSVLFVCYRSTVRI